jgi:hypothetical protein
MVENFKTQVSASTKNGSLQSLQLAKNRTLWEWEASMLKLRFALLARLALAIIGMLIVTTIAEAQDSSGSYGGNNEPLYRGSSGAMYQYDLSTPSGQLRYSVDPGAQLRDSIDPRVDLDRGLGQYGGGVRR